MYYTCLLPPPYSTGGGGVGSGKTPLSLWIMSEPDVIQVLQE